MHKPEMLMLEQLMWSIVVEALGNVADHGSDGEMKHMATGLLQLMESFDFVLIVHLMNKLLGETNDFSRCI